ncbi:MAG: hypothetical protein EXS14_01850 [Planctomycetes bacterium]|nr:hypothetical protein [Planctomycetota bacterium]
MTTERGFFNRHPWWGACLFFALLVGVGLVLVYTVGERPHYRNSTWQLFTERPVQGAAPTDSAWANDPVHVQVLVRVQSAAGAPILGVEAALARLGDTETAVFGISGAPGGHVQLPVPARFDEDLFAGRLGTTLFLPSGPQEQQIVPPDKGEWIVHYELEGRSSVAYRILEADGSAFGSDARAFPHAVVAMPDPRARGLPVVQGTVNIGGCETAKPFGLTVFAADGRAKSVTVTPADPATLQLLLPALAECCEGSAVDIEGQPVRLGFMGTIPLEAGASSSTQQLRNADGKFALVAPSGRYRIEVVTEGGHTRSGVLQGAQHGIKLQLLPTGTIIGRVADVKSGSIVALFDPEAAQQKPLAQAIVFPDGQFQLPGVPAGTWDFELRRPNFAHVRLAGLVVAPGAACADPRLQNIR